MLNIYEPVAENQIMNAGSRGACAKKSTTMPSTAQQVLFLVESVYDASAEPGLHSDNNALHTFASKFRGH